jgi:hypothetical protein
MLAGIPARLVEGLVGWQQVLLQLDKLAADACSGSQEDN